MDVDVVTDALKQSNQRITGPKYMTAGMGDAGPCHPRDNIALRFLSENLDLGYDLFDTIMVSREEQARNMAENLFMLAVDYNTPKIYIHGKSYKPGIDMIDGSYSLLVGHYLEKMGDVELEYIDPLTGDLPTEPVKGIVLLAHNAGITYDYMDQYSRMRPQTLYCEVEPGSVIVDPWRQFPRDLLEDVEVIHYGNTRPNRE
jgi:UDPglucose 6-dehydrogenase